MYLVGSSTQNVDIKFGYLLIDNFYDTAEINNNLNKFSISNTLSKRVCKSAFPPLIRRNITRGVRYSELLLQLKQLSVTKRWLSRCIMVNKRPVKVINLS